MNYLKFGDKRRITLKNNKKDSPAEELKRIEMAEEVQKTIDFLNNRNLIKTNMLSDGDHTFEELYFHRMILFSIICNMNTDISWKSQLHDDGTMFGEDDLVENIVP